MTMTSAGKLQNTLSDFNQISYFICGLEGKFDFCLHVNISSFRTFSSSYKKINIMNENTTNENIL